MDKIYPGGYVYIFWDRTFTAPAASRPGRGTYGYYEVNDRGSRNEAGSEHLSRCTSRISGRSELSLTLNLGVRTENEKMPSFRPDVQRTGSSSGSATSSRRGSAPRSTSGATAA